MSREICTDCWFHACEEGSVYPPRAGCHCCQAGHYLTMRAEVAAEIEEETNETTKGSTPSPVRRPTSGDR